MGVTEKTDKVEINTKGKAHVVVRTSEELNLTDVSQHLSLVGIGVSVGGLATLQSFFDALPTALYTCAAPSGLITFYNKQAVNLWGRTPNLDDTDERFCGSFRLWRPDGSPLPHDQTPMAVAMHEGRSFRKEEVIIERLDGTRIHVLVNIDPIRDGAGSVVGAINAFQDITSMKQGQEAQARLAAIVKTSDDAIVSKSLEGVIQSWNAAAERIFGYSAEEAVGQSINLIIPPELQDEEGQILERLRQGEQIDHFETVRVNKQGNHINLSLAISPIRDAAGKIVGASKVARDISHRKRAEKALKAKEDELELIAETTPLILARCSSDLRYLFVNRAAADLFGRTPDEIIGKTIVEVAGEAALEAIKPYIERVLSGEALEFEREMHYPAAGLRWVQVNYMPERSESDQVIGWFASITDITKRKRAEIALQQLTETLEERVKEQTTQVRHLASELITAEQSVRRRIAHLLHDDLQQMLFAIDMQLSFLNTADDKEKFNELAEMVRQGMSLTRQLSVELSPPVLEKEGLSETFSWLAQHMAEAYQLQVTLRISEPPPIASEEQRILLYHIVRELLFNVVKHAAVKSAQVTLQALPKGLSVTVSDAGQGFDLATLVDTGQTNLGLPNVHERLQLFGGRAEIISQPGAGTQIVLFMPQVQPIAGAI